MKCQGVRKGLKRGRLRHLKKGTEGQEPVATPQLGYSWVGDMKRRMRMEYQR